MERRLTFVHMVKFGGGVSVDSNRRQPTVVRRPRLVYAERQAVEVSMKRHLTDDEKVRLRDRLTAV